MVPSKKSSIVFFPFLSVPCFSSYSTYPSPSRKHVSIHPSNKCLSKCEWNNACVGWCSTALSASQYVVYYVLLSCLSVYVTIDSTRLYSILFDSTLLYHHNQYQYQSQSYIVLIILMMYESNSNTNHHGKSENVFFGAGPRESKVVFLY
jgi:hypothetical protein